MGFDGLTERNRQAHGTPASALAAPFAGNPPTGGLPAGAAMEQSDGFNVAGKKGALLKGEEHSEFDAFDDAPKAGAYSPWRSILKAVVCVESARPRGFGRGDVRDDVSEKRPILRRDVRP
jgi:hypothetical protein